MFKEIRLHMPNRLTTSEFNDFLKGLSKRFVYVFEETVVIKED